MSEAASQVQPDLGGPNAQHIDNRTLSTSNSRSQFPLGPGVHRVDSLQSDIVIGSDQPCIGSMTQHREVWYPYVCLVTNDAQPIFNVKEEGRVDDQSVPLIGLEIS